ncbi:phage portal protein [Mesorhizobium sp. M0050]|uniref:phage portal protein n=1 Tax=Mesorhizobium sp. M0050 TaxID=2956861 RepID=UPI0033371460
MGLIDRIKNVFSPRAEENSINTITMEEYARMIGGGAVADTGIYVSPETALRYTTVLICIRVLAESVASLPCILYRRRKDGGKDRAVDHPLYRVLHDQANATFTAFEYAEGTMCNLASRGNGYSYVDRNSKGQTIGLTPLHPDPVTITQAADWTPKYEVTLPDNTRAKLRPSQIHHIRGPLPKGYVGRSMIALAREAIGLGMAAESFGSHMYRNGVRPTGTLEHPGVIGPEAIENLRTQFAEKYSGLENAGKPLLLEEGMKFQALSIKPVDAEFIDSRKFQRTEIAGIFRVPAHLVNDLERATFSNIEHQTLDFIVHSLRPWLKRWEQAISRDLLMPSERDEYFAEFLIDDFLRGDFKSRMEGYALGIQNGIWSPNEIRIRENSNLREGGDEYWKPTNMYPPSAGGKPAPAKAA